MKTITWTETTEERYWDMLGMLPPAAQNGYGFLVGEPYDHGRCTVTGQVAPRFTAFVELGDRYFTAVEPLTSAEFRAVQRDDVRKAVTQ